MVDDRSWDARFANFLERVMAAKFVGADPKALQAEYVRLLAEAPADKKCDLKLKEVASVEPTKSTPTR